MSTQITPALFDPVFFDTALFDTVPRVVRDEVVVGLQPFVLPRRVNAAEGSAEWFFGFIVEAEATVERAVISADGVATLWFAAHADGRAALKHPTTARARARVYLSFQPTISITISRPHTAVGTAVTRFAVEAESEAVVNHLHEATAMCELSLVREVSGEGIILPTFAADELLVALSM